MGKTLAKIWKNRWMARSIFSSIYFNFHYLPFKQAIRLPIMLYKPHFKSLKGKIIIDAPVKFGMIRLGLQSVSIYPNTGIVYENHGGTIVFKGKAFITNDTAITIGEGAILECGHQFMLNASSKIICYHKIVFGKYCRIAWENIIMDTDLHTVTRADGTNSKGYGPIIIGDNCWIGTRTMILKNTQLPPYTTVQAQTLLNRKYDIAPKCVIGSSAEVVIKATDTYRDMKNDKIRYHQTQ